MKEHFCPAEQSTITYQGKCNWCGESEGSMTQEALKLALEALENGDVPTPENAGKNLDAITAIKEALAQTQEPVAWPCLIDSADFSENTITLVMQCDDYKVSAGKHWLSPTPPQKNT